MTYKEQIQQDRIPRHVAIIMDGNGRWAKRQGLARMFGHRKGVETVHSITEAAAALGIGYLTLYTFSTENWNRPKEEVDALMALLVDTIAKETPTLMKNNVRLQTIGDISRLPQATYEKFVACIDQTSQNTGLTLVIALSYSARWELIRSTQLIAEAVKEGKMLVEISTKSLSLLISLRLQSQTPICLFVLVVNCVLATSYCGNWHMPSCISPTACGQNLLTKSFTVR